jgi:subtilisin family serine protease
VPMAALGASLQQSLAAWRTDIEYARSGEYPELNEADVADREVSVNVTHTGDVAAMRDAGLETGYDADGVVSGIIKLGDVERLAAVPTVVEIQMESHHRIMLDTSVKELRVPWLVPPSTPWPGKGAGVIVAVIDTGIDIFHDSFRDSQGKTRILELWDQSATTGGSAPPLPFTQTRGRVYNTKDINDGITAGPPFASIDDNGHGTHVAGIAAGNGRQDDRCSFPGRYVGVAPEADLVVVKAIALPATASSNTREALAWCAQAGARHGGKAVSINCSWGHDIGPHDGTDFNDISVDNVLRPSVGPAPAGLVVTCSAGNAGDKEIHESGTVAAGASGTVSFVVPDGVADVDHLDIWYNGTATLDVTIKAPPNPAVPGSNTTGVVHPSNAAQPFPVGKMTVAVTSDTAAQSSHSNMKQITVKVSTPPKTATQPKLGIRDGIWEVTFTETGGAAAANWQAWLPTSHTDGFPTFRLPTDPPDIPERRRINTMGSPACSRNAITVASYEDDNGVLAASSSRGVPPVLPATTPVGEYKPTIAAPGVGISSPRSRDYKDSNSSCCDQKVIDLSGTSMASPHVAGLVALMLQKNKTLTFDQIRAHLQHSARIDGIAAPEVPPVFDTVMNIRAGHLWGSGKVDAAAALAEMPVAPGGGGGGGGGMISIDDRDWGYSPHTIFSRLGDWRSRFGARPGLMLIAALISEHVDEVLRLINHNKKVATVWHRQGGPVLVRHLLYDRPPDTTLVPAELPGFDLTALFHRFLPTLRRYAGPRLVSDIDRYGEFVCSWPAADLAQLDKAALRLAGQ